MVAPSPAFAEPMLRGEATPSNAPRRTKVVAVLSLMTGVAVGCAVHWSNGGRTQAVSAMPSAMIVDRMQPINVAQPVKAFQASPLTLSRYGIGTSSDPWEKLAIAAIKKINKRGFSVKAEEYNEMDEVSRAREQMMLRDKANEERIANMTRDLKLKAEELPGVTAPLGFFDPLGFSTDITTGKLLFYREVEIKHGRLAMLAALGILVGENFHPLFGGNVDVPAYIAFQQTPLQKFWIVVVSLIAIPELFSAATFDYVPGVNPAKPDEGAWWSMRDPSRVPGDFKFDPLGLRPWGDKGKMLEYQNKELNNGRLAMIAAAGMIAQEIATGKKILDFR